MANPNEFILKCKKSHEQNLQNVEKSMKKHEQFIINFISQNPFAKVHVILNKAKKTLKIESEPFITLLDKMVRDKKLICVRDNQECYLYCPEPNDAFTIDFGNKTHKII